MSTTALCVVPIAEPSGLEGWTSCCGAAVTYSDNVLCCKACWNEVDTVVVTGEAGRRLHEVVDGVLALRLTPEQGVAAQAEILAELAAEN